ncbi:pilus assembly protein [Dyella caseinilytica]|uniref:Pilus assembly protein n=1 Tax=Dyella caseinilytica TaxID=1849581 RepID=A0ABX7GZ31_9GAMM|nr:pilus assembly protein [Dyella caseinilytica]
MALAVALILLLVITLVGLAAVSGTIVQQKMSANFYDREVAFQETEAAMREAALAIENDTSAGASFNCSASSGNVCQSNPFTDTGVPASNIYNVTQYAAGGMAASQPQYIIEYMGNFQVPNPTVKQTSKMSYGQTPAPQTADFYRITARSGDPTVISDRAYVLLQSVFRN